MGHNNNNNNKILQSIFSCINYKVVSICTNMPGGTKDTFRGWWWWCAAHGEIKSRFSNVFFVLHELMMHFTSLVGYHTYIYTLVGT